MNRHHITRAAILGAAFALAPASSHAGPVSAAMPALATAPATERATIKLRNAPVDLVAYWLDSARNPAPMQIQASHNNGSSLFLRELDELPRQPGNGNGPRDLQMPAGIESIRAVGPQNVFLVKGTAAGIEEIKKLLVELDVPLKQVEVEAQFCRMSTQTLKKLPLKFMKTGGGDVPTIALVPPKMGFTMELNKGIGTGEIRVITAPRATAIDGLTAKITSTESRGLFLSPLTKKSVDGEAARKQWLPGFATIQLETGLSVTPLFQGDLVKLFTLATLDNRSANVTATLRDGDTVAIAMPADKSKGADRLVIFVTARILRRAGDEIAQAPKPAVG